MVERTFIPFPTNDAERVVFRERLRNEVLTNEAANKALRDYVAERAFAAFIAANQPTTGVKAS